MAAFRLTPPQAQAPSPIFGNNEADFAHQHERWAAFCAWADAHGFSPTEFLLPQIQVATSIEPFGFERRFASEQRTPPSLDAIRKLDPWDYQVEFGAAVSTRDIRWPMEWDYHRYRSSMLVGLAAAIAGGRAPALSVLDVACHCGVFSLDFAERGFGSVRGLDLRAANIAQAQFLAKTFGLEHARFSVANARDLRQHARADIIFCGGLFYHLTFPLEMLQDIHDKCSEFAIIDTLTQKHPFSGFHLVCSKDVGLSVEGETAHELMPTYRGMIDAIHAVGFREVYEIVGDRAGDVMFYQTHNTRSFLAVKNSQGVARAFLDRLKAAD